MLLLSQLKVYTDPLRNHIHLLSIESLYKYLDFLRKVRFKSASFSCTSCGECREALDEEYVYSEWLPGKPGKDKEEPANLFFDEHLLDTWYEIQNNAPGTSQEIFLRSLSEMSTQNVRVILNLTELI